MDYQDINAETIDRWVDEGWEWGVPIGHEDYLRATRGEWDVLLTPTKPVPHEWFGDLQGKRVLGLAAGGGQQMPIFAALGADCTVLDYSTRQLESERMVAEREGYAIRIVDGDDRELDTGEPGEILIQGRYCTFPTPRRFASEERKEWAKQFMAYAERAKAEGKKVNYHDEQCAEMYLAEDADKTPRMFDIGVHVLQLGDIVFVGLPGEIFSEIGLKIKALSPFAHTVVVELADGWHGYIAPDYVVRAGCYESIYSNISYTGLGTADVLVDGAVTMLKGLFEAHIEHHMGEIRDNRLFNRKIP
jgi:hypothetical protein